LETKYDYISIRSAFDKILRMERDICKKLNYSSNDPTTKERPMYDLPVFRAFRNAITFDYTPQGAPLPQINIPDLKYSYLVNAENKVIIQNQEYLFDYSSICNLTTGSIIYTKRVDPKSSSNRNGLINDKCDCNGNTTPVTGPVIFEKDRFVANPNYNPDLNSTPSNNTNPSSNNLSELGVSQNFTHNPDLALTQVDLNQHVSYYNRNRLRIGASAGTNWFSECWNQNSQGDWGVQLIVDIKQGWTNIQGYAYTDWFVVGRSWEFRSIYGGWVTMNTYLNVEVHSWAPWATNMPLINPFNLQTIGSANFHFNTNYLNYLLPTPITYMEINPSTQKYYVGFATGTTPYPYFYGVNPVPGAYREVVWTWDLPKIESIMARAVYPNNKGGKYIGTIECIKTYNC
jgi:hypothetical protein